MALFLSLTLQIPVSQIFVFLSACDDNHSIVDFQPVLCIISHYRLKINIASQLPRRPSFLSDIARKSGLSPFHPGLYFFPVYIPWADYR